MFWKTEEQEMEHHISSSNPSQMAKAARACEGKFSVENDSTDILDLLERIQISAEKVTPEHRVKTIFNGEPLKCQQAL